VIAKLPDKLHFYRGKELITLFTYSNDTQCAVLMVRDETFSWSTFSGVVQRHNPDGTLEPI